MARKEDAHTKIKGVKGDCPCKRGYDKCIHEIKELDRTIDKAIGRKR